MCKYRTVLSFSAISSFVSSSLIHTFPTQMSNAMKISNKSQVIAWEGSWKKTKGWFAWAGSACSSLQKSSRVLLGSLSQSITCQIESLFTFWSIHPLLLNSTQSVSLLVFSLSLKFVLLPWLYWVGLSTQRNSVPSYAAQTLHKGRASVSKMLSGLGWRGGKKAHVTVYEVTPVKSNLSSASLRSATSERHLLHCWLLILSTEDIWSF